MLGMNAKTVLFVSLFLACASALAIPPPWAIAAEKARAPEVFIGEVLDVTSPPQAPGRHRIARVRIERTARSVAGIHPEQVIKVHFEVAPPHSLGPKPIRLVESQRYALFLKVVRGGPEGRAFEVVGHGDGAILLSKDNRIAKDNLSQLIAETRRMPHLAPGPRDELCGLYEKLRDSLRVTPPPKRRPGPPAPPRRPRRR